MGIPGLKPEAIELPRVWVWSVWNHRQWHIERRLCPCSMVGWEPWDQRNGNLSSPGLFKLGYPETSETWGLLILYDITSFHDISCGCCTTHVETCHTVSAIISAMDFPMAIPHSLQQMTWKGHQPWHVPMIGQLYFHPVTCYSSFAAVPSAWVKSSCVVRNGIGYPICCS